MTSSDPYARWLGSLLQQEGLLALQEGRWELADGSDLPAMNATACVQRGLALVLGMALCCNVLTGFVAEGPFCKRVSSPTPPPPKTFTVFGAL